MTKVLTFFGLVVLIGLFASATSAYAEFGSKESKGTTRLYETTFEGGGASIACTAFSEESSKASWTIKKEGTAQTKGPDLLIAVGNWGKCEAKKPLEGSVKVSSCEFEIEQLKAEMKLVGKVVTTCTLETVPGCKITIPSGSNKGLKVFEIAKSGEKGETTDVYLSVSGVTTEVNETCKKLGIANSKEGKIGGLWEARQAEANGTREYAISAPKSVINNEVFLVSIKRIGGANGTLPPGRIIVFQSGNAMDGQFTVTLEELTACGTTFNYLLNGASCEFSISYDKTKGLGYVSIVVEGGANGNVRTPRVVLGD